MKISLAMIVKNGEKYIERCLKSVNELVDEIIVVDTGSNDSTIEILQKYKTVDLYHFMWCDDFSVARNYAIEKANGDYILVLDSDEYIVKGTRAELDTIMQKGYVGKILIISDYIKDEQIFKSNAYVSRFFPRDVRYIGTIHEQINTRKIRVEMDLTVNHSGYIEGDKSKRNIPMLLKEVKKSPLDSYYIYQLGKELRINKQYEESFLLLKRAYELTEESKLFYKHIVIEMIDCGKEINNTDIIQIIQENEQKLKDLADFHFSKGLFYLNYSYSNPNIAERFLLEIENAFLSCLKLRNHEGSEIIKGTSTFLPAYNLGVYYEVLGNIHKAIEFYQLSSSYGYVKAERRLQSLL